jgi:hypothetical protein
MEFRGMAIIHRILRIVRKRARAAWIETRIAWCRFVVPDIRPHAPKTPLTPSDVFDAIYVINLDRSIDRWKALQPRLAAVGIEAERFLAIDGSAPEQIAAWEAYQASDIAVLPPGVAPLGDPEIYESGDHALRVASAETRAGSKWINTRGGFGIAQSMRACLLQALETGHEHVLILEDDVVFHRDFAALFSRAAAGLPSDWAFFQLGSMRTEWEGATRWRSPNLLMNGGMAIGAHAVGYSREAMKETLSLLEDPDGPYDVGPLSTATWRLRDRCFVCMPQIGVQEVKDSNNNASGLLKQFGRARMLQLYRWHEANYLW